VQQDESITVGNDRTKHIGQTERVNVGRNQSITIGVNRTAQIGNNDTIMVGHQHVVRITPSGEAGPSTTMVDKKIVLDTGAGATITMSGSEITLRAEKIHVLGDKEINGTVSSGELRLNGGPHVKVNC
jgi:type VI secretion system secreted protein VgrG